MRVNRIKLMNPSNPNKSTNLLNGAASGILHWDDIPFPQFYAMYKRLQNNFWRPSEINMKKDKQQWGTSMNRQERRAFKRINGLLSSLDSVQTRLVLELGLFISDPSVHAILGVIAQQEATHNESYSYIFASLVPLQEQKEVFDMARLDPIVQKRNKLVLDLYEDFRADPTPLKLAKALVGCIILEGINFYSGFAFFYHLARNNKMVGTSTMISYIQKDEMAHGQFIAMLLRALLAEHPEIDQDGSFTDFTYEVIGQAVELEIEWSRDVLADIDDIDLYELEGYVKYIANKRLNVLGLDELYEGYDENIMPWIKAYSDESINDTKTDFFEQKSRLYVKAGDDNGFDDL